MQAMLGKESITVDYLFSAVDFERQNCWLETDAIWQVTATPCFMSMEDSDISV